jgi:hypothetical protein
VSFYQRRINMGQLKTPGLVKSRLLWLLLAVISIFAVLFTGSVRWGSAQQADASPAVIAEPQSPQGWGDEGIKEVGVEWINDFPGTADDRSHWDESCDGLYYGLTGAGWTGRFHWTDWNAFETDFKLSSAGGDENSWVDSVDIAMVCTHGAGAYDSFWGQDLSSVYFGSTHADHHLSPGDAYRAYGDKDLEYLAFDSCSVLSDGGPAPYYNRGYWSTVMQGLHLLLGFKNTMYVNAPGDGAYWALFMKGFGWFMPPISVTQAWFSAVDYNQPTITCARVIAETSYNFNEYLHGYGPVGADPAVDGYYYYWDHCSTGAKKLDLESFTPSEPTLAVPIFEVQKRLVNEDYVLNRIGPAFDITGTLGSDDLFFYLQDTSGGLTRTLMVDKITGSYNYRNWSKLWVTPVVTPTLPLSGRTADMLASNFFSQIGEGLPAAWYRNAGYFYNIEEMVQEQLLSGEVNGVQEISRMPADGMLTYGRNVSGPALTASGIQMADFPLVGPGGRLKLYFGDGSVLVGVMGGSRDVIVTKAMVDVMTAEEAWGKYLEEPTIALPEVPWVASYITYTTAALGYYEMPYIVEQTELIPVWIFNAFFYGPAMELLAGDVPVNVPAAVQYLPPEVSITSPVPGGVFIPGTPIPFDGIVTGGKPPYTFKWSSSVDGILGNMQAIIAELTGAVKAGEVITHAIELEVTDANGQSGSATVLIKVLARVYLPPILKPTPK